MPKCLLSQQIFMLCVDIVKEVIQKVQTAVLVWIRLLAWSMKKKVKHKILQRMERSFRVLLFPDSRKFTESAFWQSTLAHDPTYSGEYVAKLCMEGRLDTAIIERQQQNASLMVHQKKITPQRYSAYMIVHVQVHKCIDSYVYSVYMA